MLTAKQCLEKADEILAAAARVEDDPRFSAMACRWRQMGLLSQLVELWEQHAAEESGQSAAG